MAARDNRFTVCKNTEEGRIYFIWFRIEKEFIAFKKKLCFDKAEKVFFKNYTEL